jgi:hypothetical protein
VSTTNDEDRLRRHLQALAAVNRQLHAQVADVAPNRRAPLAKEWLEQIRATPVPGDPVLVRRAGRGVWVLEGGVRRPVRSGLLASALEQALGGVGTVTDAELDACAEGAPVEIFEAPTGPPFVIVGRRRLPVRGLPVPSPIAADDALAFPEGPELRLRTGPGPDVVGAKAVRELPLPTFLIIGAQKSATRWLRSNMGRHPDVFTPPHEPSFFNHEDAFHEKGLAWYRTQFEGWTGEAHVGESTPGYMMWRHKPERVARRIDRTLPGVRLIAILRNPLDRAQSAMLHHMKRGRLPADARLVDLIRAVPAAEDQLGLVAGGWYAASLRPFHERFGDRLLILLHDDLADDAPGVYRRALEHVGADPDFVPPELEQVRFSNRRGPTKPQDLTPRERFELWDLYRDDVADLERMIGRDLSIWVPEEPVEEPGPAEEPELADEPELAHEQEMAGDEGDEHGQDDGAAGGADEGDGSGPSPSEGQGGRDDGDDEQES